MAMGGSSSASSGKRAQLADLRSKIANEKNPAKANAMKIQADQLEREIGAEETAERIRKLKESERFNGISGKKLKL